MRSFLVAMICLIGLVQGLSQQSISEKKRLAQEFYAFGRFEEARGLLSGDRTLSREDKEGRFLLALCYYQLNELDRSALLLNELIKEEKTPYPECWLYMGKIYHSRHQFDKAAEYYKAYLKLMDQKAEKRRLIWDEIERCANGLAMQYQEQRAFAENLGVNVNTKYDEFAAIPSATRNDRLYFSSARKGSVGGLRNAAGQLEDRFGYYRSDIYACTQEKGVWAGVEPMDYLLNGPQNDMLLDIKSDGSVLYYFNEDRDGGYIKTDTFRQGGERLLTSDIFPGPIDPRRGDRRPHFVNDTLVFFDSNRPGGYGGYDLYKIVYARGRWSPPQNLGPDVNTPYDEVSPFQARDLQTLYFSTNHPNYSIGGLDVVKSVYVPEINRWTPPQNIGMPINSAADDLHFRLAKDGFSGFMTSSRKDGFGLRDIYAVFFQDFLEEMEPPSAPVFAQAAPPPVPPQPVFEAEEESVIVEQPVELAVRPPRTAEPLPAVEPPAAAEETLSVEPPAVSAVLPPTPIVETTMTDTPPEGEAAPAPIMPILVEDGFNFDDRDREVLNALAQMLVAHADRRLVVTAYSNQHLNQARQINEGMNLAEGVATYLFQQGVSSHSLFLRAALADLSRTPNQSRIVAFNFTETDLTPKGFPEVTLQNPWLDLTSHKLHQELLYKVQVAASKKNNFVDRILEDYVDPMIEKRPDFPYYRYTIGAFSAFRPAGQMRQELIQLGTRSAFPVPYVAGWRLEGNEIQQKSADYPDLKKFLGN